MMPNMGTVWKMDSKRDFDMHFIAMACCHDEQTVQHLYEPLMWHLSRFDDETLTSAAMIANLDVANTASLELAMSIRNIIMSDDYLEIRTVSNHLELVESGEVSISGLSCLIGTLRDLELMGKEDEYYPYLQAHTEVSRFGQDYRSAYHHNEELVRLVHDHHDKTKDIINLMFVQGMKDAGLVREHLLNKAPALSDGIL